MQNARIVIADRSELAGNLYRILLKSTGASLIVRRRFEEARPHFFRREAVHLAIFNSNIFGRKFPEIFKRLVEDEALKKVRKIFICRETASEAEWRDKLEKIQNSQVIIRPFHPDEFALIVKKYTGAAL